jgi:MoaA/NifB/PqqE/SkfB family radical SAM enzyme
MKTEIGCGVSMRDAMPLGKISPLEVIQEIGTTGLSGGVDDICFYSTYACNLKCYMCLVEHLKKSGSKSMTAGAVKEAFKDKAVKTMFYLGGEPFLNKELPQILEYFDEKGTSQIIATNATNLSKEVIVTLAKLKNLVVVQASLNGPGEKDDEIRGNQSSFNKSVENIELLKQAGIKVWIHCTILNENVHDLGKMVELGCNLGVDAVNFIFAHVTTEQEIAESKALLSQWLGQEVNVDGFVGKLDYSKEELLLNIKDAKEVGEKRNMQVMFFSKLFGDRPELYWEGSLLNEEKPICQLTLMPPLTPALAPNGDVFLCPYISKSFGNINKTSIDNIWDSEPFQIIRKEMINGKLLPICRRCPCTDTLKPSGNNEARFTVEDWKSYLEKLTGQINSFPDVQDALQQIGPVLFQYRLKEGDDYNFWHLFNKDQVVLGYGENKDNYESTLYHTTRLDTLYNINAGLTNPVQATMEGIYSVDGATNRLMDCVPMLQFTIKAHKLVVLPH